MKNQWMDHFAEQPSIDGVEFYSVTFYNHTSCELPVVTVRRPAFQRNPSSHLLFEIFTMYIKRSFADWLFLIGDAAYIDHKKLFTYFSSVIGRPRNFAQGSCVERRFYFQMFSITSGILISRETVEALLGKKEMWNVTFETGLPAEEALSQILDSIGIVVRSRRKDTFLGQRFRNPGFNRNLLEKKFDKLKHCQRPNADAGSSGVAAVCSTEITPFRELIVWAGGGRNESEKEWFLQNAEAMLRDVPESVHFVWDRLFPELCIN
jgi:hypothetical protein